MTAVVFLEEAEDEFLEAIRYYTEHSRALGVDFVTEVQRAVDFAIQLPQAAPLVRPDVHKKTLRKFPYSLLYSVEGETVVILAIAHQKRRPEYWVNRVK